MLYNIYFIAAIINAVLFIISFLKSVINLDNIKYRKRQGYTFKTDKALAIRSIIIPVILAILEIWIFINLHLQVYYN